MDSFQFFDRLDLYDDRAFYEQVDPIPDEIQWTVLVR